MICPRCGAENAPTYRFCRECGAPLQAKCPQCGEEVEPGVKFCPHCGYRLAPSASAVSSPEPAAAAPVTPPPAYTPPAAPTPPPAYVPPAAPPPPVQGPAYRAAPTPPASSGAPYGAGPAYGGSAAPYMSPSAPPPPSTPPAYVPPTAPPPGAYGAPAAFGPAAAGYVPPVAPAAPAFEYKGVLPRFLAALIDGVILGIPMYLLMGATMMRAMRTGYVNPGKVYGPAFLVSLISIAYYIVLEAYGGTLGKRILGMRIVDANGNPPGFGKSLLRNLLRLVDGLFGYIVGAIIVASSPTKQRLGDKVAGTYVVGK